MKGMTIITAENLIQTGTISRKWYEAYFGKKSVKIQNMP
jgi:hypothetical protein